MQESIAVSLLHHVDRAEQGASRVRNLMQAASSRAHLVAVGNAAACIEYRDRLTAGYREVEEVLVELGVLGDLVDALISPSSL
jgi:hypothetical protein